MTSDFVPGLTVGELMEVLAAFPAEMPVVALYDTRCAGGSIREVETGPGPDDDRQSVVLIVG